MRFLRLAALSLLSALVAVSSADAGGLRISLLSGAEVQGDTILLRDLLPAGVSQRIRAAAQKIPLGPAPQNGATRQIGRESLTLAIAAAGFSPSNFEIPGSVAVRRGCRLISRQEIFSAIASALEKNPLPGIPTPEIQDIAFEPEICDLAGGAGLQVTQITFDRFIGRERFRLSPKSEVAVPPFYVTAVVPAGPSDSLHDYTLAGASGPVTAHPSSAKPVSAPAFVSTNQLAQLHLHSSDLDMILHVRPLQAGRLGEVIRVRLPGTGHTLQARVVGKGLLDAAL